MSHRGWFLTLALALLAPHVADAQLREAPIPRVRGQSVTPAFEGWYKNPDGTCSVSFGYLNRNYEERLDIPVGPNNRIQPGPPDQGQPTHFLPRRQTGVFTVNLPDCAAAQNTKLSWTIVSAGQTISIPANLKPEWEIDALREATTANTPPIIRFAAEGPPAQGPRGVSTTMTAAAGVAATLDVWVTDDGVVRTGTGPGAGRPALGVVWSKFRGAGDVAFAETEPKIDANGKATTKVTFSAPGDYVLRVLTWDNSGRPGNVMAGGFQCCWTNGYVTVKVK